MARYKDEDLLIRELSEISGELNAQSIGAAVGRVPTANVVERNVFEAVLEELCIVRDQLERERQLVRDLIREQGLRYEHN